MWVKINKQKKKRERFLEKRRNKKIFCLCNKKFSWEKKIYCQNDLCRITLFHFSCVNINRRPKGKWFCPECECRGDSYNVMNPEAEAQLEQYCKQFQKDITSIAENFKQLTVRLPDAQQSLIIKPQSTKVSNTVTSGTNTKNGTGTNIILLKQNHCLSQQRIKKDEMESFDYAELKNDKNFIDKISKFSESLDKIGENINDCLQKCNGKNELSINEKIKSDLYMSYCVNSLYWTLLKISGKDSNNHGIKNELSRIRESMIRQKEIHDRNTIRPTINKEVANRFIKGNLALKRKSDSNNLGALKKPTKKIFTENLSDSE